VSKRGNEERKSKKWLKYNKKKSKKRGMVSKWERIIEISLYNWRYQKYIWRLKLKDKSGEMSEIK
jgi:hypothetical protein